MEKIKSILNKIENARMHLQADKEAKYRLQLEKWMMKVTSPLELEVIKRWWNEMDERTLLHLKEHLNAYQARAKSKIVIENREYDLKIWCTISQYAKIHGYKSTEAVSNQIRRGLIAADSITYIPELDIRLIKI